MSKSFDDFIKQQQLAQNKPKGFGYRNNNNQGYNYNQAYGMSQPFQPTGQSYQNYNQGYNQGYQNYNQGYQNYNQGYNQNYNNNNRYNNTQNSGISSPASSVPTSGRNTPNPNASTTSLTSLNTALSKLNVSNLPFEENLSKIESASKIAEVRPEVETIISIIAEEESLSVINEWKLNDILKSLLKPKNSPLVKEAALLIIQQLATKFGGQTPKEAYLLQFLSTAYDMFTDKDKNVIKAAKSATDSLYGIFPVEALGSIVLDEYLTILKSGAKWNSKVAALVNFDRLIEEVPADVLEMKFIDVVPVLTDLSTDFKPELAKAGITTLKKFVKVLDNLDLQNKYDLIVETLADPQKSLIVSRTYPLSLSLLKSLNQLCPCWCQFWINL